ncbi:HepT-like ribonuclease domain-containing protein [Granulicella sp. dw_53]|uniref:HepT-like ribonuclease domain-containing protein n=1 Tax=Granulicella sp. dw_53 TaxID=2719792 RepID=UPI001BD29993|nr:HepT-like ribonuclease domain-containing protein [Granulicella sp. dw_53]
MLRSAVRGELMIIGEAMNQMLHHFPETNDRVTLARRIVDFRNLLIHEYGEVDERVVWSIVITSLPSLKDEVDSWMRELEG